MMKMMVMMRLPVDNNAGRKGSGHDNYGHYSSAYPFQKFFAHWFDCFADWSVPGNKSLMNRDHSIIV